MINPIEIKEFCRTVYAYYKSHGRIFPWRTTSDPYHIFVSEVMLQQTQTDRVLPKYEAFLKVLPSIKALASASQHEVLALWQGLGYNRRALMLQRAAQQIVALYGGHFPDDPETLCTLPGIGPYTSHAIATFAFDLPLVFIETNIRTVFLHHFFADESDVLDAALFPYIEASLDYKNPRHWYYALMDYGVMIKKTIGNPNRRSRHYTKQSTFVGSDRQIRGELVRRMLAKQPLSSAQIAAFFDTDPERVLRIMCKLRDEGLISF